MIPVSWIVAGVAAVAVGGYVLHCEHVKKDRAAFISKLEAQAEAQRLKNKETEDANREAKSKVDADNTKLRAANAALADRLRAERARANLVPAASATSRRPDLACFDRAELGRALSRFEERVAGIAEEGDARTVDLDSAKAWAKARK